MNLFYISLHKYTPERMRQSGTWADLNHCTRLSVGKGYESREYQGNSGPIPGGTKEVTVMAQFVVSLCLLAPQANPQGG